MTVLKLIMLILILMNPMTGSAGLEAHRDLLVADRLPLHKLRRGEIRITYLGTNGYLFQSRNTTLIVDPYVSRIGMLSAAFNSKITPDPAQIHQLLTHLPRRVDAVIVTHGHIDHLLDAPPIARATGARLIASHSSVLLAKTAGAPDCQAVQPGDLIRAGKSTVHVLPADHDRLFGRIPFPGSRLAPGRPPKRVADWVCGEPLAFLIELEGRRIYVDSGGTLQTLPPRGPVDLAILGVALPDARARFVQAAERLEPRYILPGHQDDFFRPVQRGFRFGLLTGFPQIRRSARDLPGQLILLDYYRPWTLR